MPFTRWNGGRSRAPVLLLALLFATSALAGCASPQEGGGDGNDTNGDDNQTGDGGDGTEMTFMNVTGHDDVAANEYWFEVEGEEGRNPDLTLPANTEVSIRFENVGETTHNLHLGGPLGEQTEVIQPGEVRWLNVTVPAADAEDADDVGSFEEEGENLYWCDPHFGLGMRGNLTIEDSGAGSA